MAIKRFYIIFALTALFALPAIADDNKDIEFSGFGRVIGGYLDTDKAYFNGYEDKLTFTEKSLVGFQADYALTDTLSLSGQLLLHSDNDDQSGLEWLYLSYNPNPDWQFNIGRQRTPYLKYSDVFDVGYAYPWISPPRQLYSNYLFFPRYEGINARYRFNINEVYIDVEGYYGDFSDEININSIRFHLEANDIYGSTIEVNYRGWQLRGASFFVDEVDAGADGINQLTHALLIEGFDDLAGFFTIQGRTKSYILGLTYDSMDWVVSAEYVDVSATIPIFAGIENFYFTLGRYLGDYQLLVTYSQANQGLTEFENTVPEGVSPTLDLLREGINDVAARFPKGGLESITLTGRWDFRPAMALKAEISFLNGDRDNTSLFELKPGAEAFDGKAVLYQFGIEWVF